MAITLEEHQQQFPNPPPAPRSTVNQLDAYIARIAQKNLYDDGPLSVVTGGPHSMGLPLALSSVDAFAIAHRLRNIGKALFGSIDFKSGLGNALSSTGKSAGFQFVS